MADLFEGGADAPPMRGMIGMPQLVLAVALETARDRKLGDLTEGRPRLAAWLAPMSDLASMRATAPPPQ
jgi:hypothetical protein